MSKEIPENNDTLDNGTERVRVCSASLIVTEIVDERGDTGYLQVMSLKKFNAGTREFSPLGGALEFHPETEDFLLSIGAKFEDGNDLRMTLPVGNVDTYQEWFEAREGRESSPVREIYEELVTETKLLTDISEDDYNLTFAGNLVSTGESTRPGAEILTTRYFHEVYHLTFNEAKRAEILAHIYGEPIPRPTFLRMEYEHSVDPTKPEPRGKRDGEVVFTPRFVRLFDPAEIVAGICMHQGEAASLSNMEELLPIVGIEWTEEDLETGITFRSYEPIP